MFPWLTAFVVDNGGSTRLVLLVTMHITSAFRCLEVPQVQFLRLWTSLCSHSDKLGSHAQWNCLRYSSSRRLRTFPWRNRDGYAQCSCAWCALFTQDEVQLSVLTAGTRGSVVKTVVLGAAHHRGELRWGFFGALYTGTRPGHGSHN